MENTCTRAEMARLLGISERKVRKLADQNILEKTPTGQIIFAPSIKHFVLHEKEKITEKITKNLTSIVQDCLVNELNGFPLSAEKIVRKYL